MQDTLAVILAGGMGSRLSPSLTIEPNPQYLLAASIELLILPLTNCLHSGLRRILVLTQYKSHSYKHLRDGWSVLILNWVNSLLLSLHKCAKVENGMKARGCFVP